MWYPVRSDGYLQRRRKEFKSDTTAPEIEAPKASTGGYVEGVSPPHPTRGLGERRMDSARGAPAENGFWCIFKLKNPSKAPF